MQIDECKNYLQKFTKEKITYEKMAIGLGLKGKQSIGMRKARSQDIEDWEIEKLKSFFGINKLDSQDDVSIDADYFPEVFGSCGNGVFVLSETKEKITIPQNCFTSPISKFKKYSVINAKGNSMEPYIHDKDKLIVEHLELGEKIQDDKVYVFCYNEQIMVKRLYYNVDEIIVKSDNPDPIFKIKYIQKEDMNNVIIIGQIVGLMRDCR